MCCDDKQHCCPPNLPVCDTQGGRCLPSANALTGGQPWLTKTKATRTAGFGGAVGKLLARRGGGKDKQQGASAAAA